MAGKKKAAGATKKKVMKPRTTSGMKQSMAITRQSMPIMKSMKQHLKNHPAPVFEMIVILAIVVIVAVTGQVLIFYGKGSAYNYEDNGITGFAIAGDGSSAELDTGYTDIGVAKIETDPVSPMIGQPFEVKVIIENKGTAEITTPFYVGLRFAPQNNEAGSLEPITLESIMTKMIRPGEKAELSMFVTAVMPEGPMRIVALADSTVKLDDTNPSDNQMSKTIIVSSAD